VFYDIDAVVHFLRKVIWIVPGFTVDGYRERLVELHQRMATDGSIVAHAQRFLIEARPALVMGDGPQEIEPEWARSRAVPRRDQPAERVRPARSPRVTNLVAIFRLASSIISSPNMTAPVRSSSVACR
jgi:hypothetical protein